MRDVVMTENEKMMFKANQAMRVYVDKIASKLPPNDLDKFLLEVSWYCQGLLNNKVEIVGPAKTRIIASFFNGLSRRNDAIARSRKLS